VDSNNWIAVQTDDSFSLYIDPDSIGLTESQTLTAFAEWKASEPRDPAKGKKLAAKILYSYFKDQFDKPENANLEFPVNIKHSVSLTLSKGNSQTYSAAYAAYSLAPSSWKTPDILITQQDLRASKPFTPSNWNTTNYSVQGYGSTRSHRDQLLPNVFTQVAKIIEEEDARRTEIFDKYRPLDQKGLMMQIDEFQSAGMTMGELSTKLPGIVQPNGDVSDYILSGSIPLTEFAVRIGNEGFVIGLNTQGKK